MLRSLKPRVSWCALGIVGSPQWEGVHRVGFIVFWLIMEKLLNIEYFIIINSFKWELKATGEFGCIPGAIGKPLVSKIEWG